MQKQHGKHNEYNDLFTGIEYFKGTFPLQAKGDPKPYQVLPKHIGYALQEPFRKELERLKEHQILAPLWADKISKWYNSFVIVSKPNDIICLCLDPT